MRYEDLPVFELHVVFAAERERAGAIADAVVGLVCRETGGSGEDDGHVCRGFHAAGLREVPGGLLDE